MLIYPSIIGYSSVTDISFPEADSVSKYVPLIKTPSFQKKIFFKQAEPAINFHLIIIYNKLIRVSKEVISFSTA
ncbi:MAG TPA: hypothetical protein VJ279_07025, partial [Hanamia sp.]|nr:hypothetical protein [Hanamia sp.]